MGFLKDVFDDVVDIAAAPVRLGAAVVDEVFDTDTLDDVKEVTEKVKGN